MASVLDLSQILFWTDKQLLDQASVLACDKDIQKLIETKISSCQGNECSYSQIASDWLKWCNEQSSRVKVTEYTVPDGILPPKCKGSLYDIKVQGKRRCPDDTLYNKYADLR